MKVLGLQRELELGGGEMGSGWGMTDPPLHTHLCHLAL